MFVGTLGGLGAVVLMGLEALNCLLTCRGKRRTRLLYAAAGLGIVLLLWWGGDALLRLIGLSWRRWVQTAFGVAAPVSYTHLLYFPENREAFRHLEFFDWKKQSISTKGGCVAA